LNLAEWVNESVVEGENAQAVPAVIHKRPGNPIRGIGT
jgi:hypothetical protein